MQPHDPPEHPVVAASWSGGPFKAPVRLVHAADDALLLEHCLKDAMQAPSWQTPGNNQWCLLYRAFAIEARRGWEYHQTRTLADALCFRSGLAPHSLFVLDEGRGLAVQCGLYMPTLYQRREEHPVIGFYWQGTNPQDPSPQEYLAGALLLASLLAGLPKVSGRWLFTDRTEPFSPFSDTPEES